MNTQTSNRAPSVSSTLYPSLSYDDALAAIAWLERAFGFQRRLVVQGPNGTVAHSELSLGDALIMVSTSKPELGRKSPRAVGCVTQALCMRIDEPDAHFERARTAGAEVLRAPRDEEYGSRGYMVRDPEGHVWYFGTYRPGAYWDGAHEQPK